MAQYYFLVSSLPSIKYEDTAAPISSEQLMEYCREQCSSAHYAVLEQVTWDYPLWHDHGHSVLYRYWIWEGALQNELARLRGQKLGVDVSKSLAEVPALAEVQSVAAEAMKQESPLDAEDFLNRSRWNYLAQEQVGHYFDFDAIVIYYLQLQLLERRLSFDPEKGFARYKEIYDDILQNVDTTIFPGVTE